MRPVRQKYKNNAKRVRVWGGVAVLAVAALASGLRDDDTNGARPVEGPQQALHAPPARALDSYAARLRAQQAARAVAAKHWG